MSMKHTSQAKHVLSKEQIYYTSENTLSYAYSKLRSGVILETEGSFFTNQLKREPLIWPSPMFMASLQLCWWNKIL